MTTSYRTAVIGCGRTASLLEDDPLRAKPCSHMGHYRSSRRFRVVAGADLDDGRRADFEKRWHVRSSYLDYRELLKEERPEVVSLTAYAPERHRMFKDCVEAGVKAVWIEKAIATSLRGARSMVRLAQKYQTITVVNHPRRWNPRYLRARALIAAGAIGVPESITATFSGQLIHTGTHAFDIMRFFFGDVTAVQGTPDPREIRALGGMPRSPIPDLGGSGTLRFANGATGTIQARAKDYFVFEFEVLGSAGALRLGNTTSLNLYQPAPSRYATSFCDLARVPVPAEIAKIGTGPRRPGAVRDLLAGFSRGHKSVNDLSEGVKALEIALAFHESFQRGGETVKLPLKKCTLKIQSR